LSIIDYGIGITKDGIGSLNQNSSTTWVVAFIVKTQPKVLIHMVSSSSMWAFFKLNDLSVVVDVFKFQIMRLIMCHNVH
jgi:hypothetical protein